MSQLTAGPVHEDVGAGASYVRHHDMIVDYMDSPMTSEFPQSSPDGNLQVKSFDSSPSQIPFDDPAIRPPPLRQPSFASSQKSSSSPIESTTDSIDSSGPYSSTQQHSTTSLQRPRPELLHATRSSPGPRGAGGSQRPDFDGFTLHDESPFEAARRAQLLAKSTESLPKQSQERKFIPGRVPSIKPGEIMPDYLIPLLHGPPTFAPPMDAPPFPPLRPPIVHPIHAAHFPTEAVQPGFIPSSASQPLPYPSGPDQQSLQSLPPSSLPSHTATQTADMSRSPPPVRPQQQPQLLRSFSRVQTPPPPVNGQKSQSPNSSRRHTYDPSRLGPPSVSNGNYPPPPMPPPPDMSQGPLSAQPLSRSVSQYYVSRPSPPPEVPTLPVPHHAPPQPLSRSASQYRPSPPPEVPTLPVPHHPPPQPLSRSASQYHASRPSPPPEVPTLPVPHYPPPQPLSRSASQYHASRPSPPPEVPTLPLPRDPFRHSQRPSPLSSEFVPAPSPIRLPSENMGLKAPASLSNRSTPKPVMPPLLAPLANGNNNASRSAPHLQRSMSSGQEKGGFLSKTKSLLRKRTSGSGLKLRPDGGISFAPPMHTVQEEDAKPGKKLNKRK